LIIDAHVHITSPEIIRNAESIAKREAYFALLAKTPKNRYATGEQLIGEMESCGVGKAVVFGFSFMDMGLCREANDYTAEMVRKYPRLIGFMSLSPSTKGVEAEIDRCTALGLKGVGEIFPDGQDFPIDDFAVTKNFGNLLKERSLPVIIHTNEPVGHYYPGKTKTTPEKAAKLAENHPGLKILFAHFGGGLLFYELMPEMKGILKDVFYDTAALPFLYNAAIYDAAVSMGVMEKIVFGSDYPLISPKRYLNKVNLSPVYADMLFNGNVSEFLSHGGV
jgi:hypothetical protein